MTRIDETKIVLAAYGTPGIYAIERLFALGLAPSQIGLMTHYTDDRNGPLIWYADVHDISITMAGPKSNEAFDWLWNFYPDVLFSLHYRERIIAELLEVPKYGCVNLHPSLLPNYRGTFSIPWALINGEDRVGFTWHYMTPKFDDGNMLAQLSYDVLPWDTAFSLFHKAIIKGVERMDDVLFQVLHRATGYPQAEGGSYYKRELPYGGRIDPAWSDDKIDRFIRAMYFPPHPPAYLKTQNGGAWFETFAQYSNYRERTNA
jgi:methionyl-tRNA formyltransferase